MRKEYPTLLINGVEKGFENCIVTDDFGNEKRGRYKWTRKDGKHIIEVSNGHFAKTRTAFNASSVRLYDGVELVQR